MSMFEHEIVYNKDYLDTSYYAPIVDRLYRTRVILLTLVSPKFAGGLGHAVLISVVKRSDVEEIKSRRNNDCVDRMGQKYS